MTKTKKPDLTGTVVMNLLFALPLTLVGYGVLHIIVTVVCASMVRSPDVDAQRRGWLLFRALGVFTALAGVAVAMAGADGFFNGATRAGDFFSFNDFIELFFEWGGYLVAAIGLATAAAAHSALRDLPAARASSRWWARSSTSATSTRRAAQQGPRMHPAFGALVMAGLIAIFIMIVRGTAQQPPTAPPPTAAPPPPPLELDDVPRSFVVGDIEVRVRVPRDLVARAEHIDHGADIRRLVSEQRRSTLHVGVILQRAATPAPPADWQPVVCSTSQNQDGCYADFAGRNVTFLLLNEVPMDVTHRDQVILALRSSLAMRAAPARNEPAVTHWQNELAGARMEPLVPETWLPRRIDLCAGGAAFVDADLILHDGSPNGPGPVTRAHAAWRVRDVATPDIDITMPDGTHLGVGVALTDASLREMRFETVTYGVTPKRARCY